MGKRLNLRKPGQILWVRYIRDTPRLRSFEALARIDWRGLRRKGRNAACILLRTEEQMSRYTVLRTRFVAAEFLGERRGQLDTGFCSLGPVVSWITVRKADRRDTRRASRCEVDRYCRSRNGEEQATGSIRKLAQGAKRRSNSGLKRPGIWRLHLRAPDGIGLTCEPLPLLLKIPQNLAECLLLFFPVQAGGSNFGLSRRAREAKFPDQPHGIAERFAIDFKLHVIGIAGKIAAIDRLTVFQNQRVGPNGGR